MFGDTILRAYEIEREIAEYLEIKFLMHITLIYLFYIIISQIGSLIFRYL